MQGSRLQKSGKDASRGLGVPGLEGTVVLRVPLLPHNTSVQSQLRFIPLATNPSLLVSVCPHLFGTISHNLPIVCQADGFLVCLLRPDIPSVVDGRGQGWRGRGNE